MISPQQRGQRQVRSSQFRDIRSSTHFPGFPAGLARTVARVARRYAFRANASYLELIDWDDPDDPIRQLIIPQAAELDDWGRLDASDEAANTVVRGVQHKYCDTALVLAASTCAGYCRYCFRKRLFMRHDEEVARDLTPAYRYVARHPEITDVLLSGGDPLVLSTPRLADMVRRFAAMPHVRTVRVGSKVPAFNPRRILDDRALLDLIADIAAGGTAFYLMAHFDHPRELTDPARRAIRAVQDAGGHAVNQCPLIRGVNDDPEVLRELFETATELGVPQYYVFQGRPTAGNAPFEVPLVRSWRIFDCARRRCSGLSRRVRLVMSHASGKIEVLGVDAEHIFLRYHRALDAALESRFLVCRRDDDANWLDQLEVLAGG